MVEPTQTTRLLRAARDGDREAFDLLYRRLYDELRRIARSRLRRQGSDSLDTTELVHEAYLKLADVHAMGASDRSHFLALASRAMRFVLVDHARERSAAKRGGSVVRVTLDPERAGASTRGGAVDGAEATDGAVRLLEVNDALERLMAYDRRLGQVVEHRFFGGMTHEEVAEVTGRSVPTVKRDWSRARAWLYRLLSTSETASRAAARGGGGDRG